jgi:hypothetical protein
VWPFVIQLLHEVVEAGLLQGVHARRSGCLLFEGQMHALTTTVLLGMAWLYALDGNAEPQPGSARSTAAT